MRKRRSLLTIVCACVLGTLAGAMAQAAGVHNCAREFGSSRTRILNVRRCLLVRSAFRDDFVDTLDPLDRVVDIEAGRWRQREQPVRSVVDRPGIAVLVYNYAAVPADTMSRARENVNRLFCEAGVEIRWLDPIADSRYRFSPTSNTSHAFTVQILIRSMRASRGPSTPESVMGEAFPAAENGGTMSLFYDQVVRVARQYGQPLADILGLAITHEMGHLLLPARGHSDTGIMRAEWGGDDVRRVVVGALAFTVTQAALIRATIDACCLHGTKSRTANGDCHCQPEGHDPIRCSELKGLK